MVDYVDPYPGRTGKERITEPCGRCGGSGIYDAPSSASFHTKTVGFVTTGCFACMGTGEHSFLVSSARAKARRHAREAVARQEKIDAARQRAASFREQYGELFDRAKSILDTLRSGDPFHRKLSWNLSAVTGGADFDAEPWATELREILEAYDQRELMKRPAPTGRLEITGTILSAKYVDSDYGSTLKMLVEGDGWKVWGTVPKQLADDEYGRYYDADDNDPRYDGIAVWTKALIGRKVTFTATVKVNEDDPSFGFFTRPTKATISDIEAA